MADPPKPVTFRATLFTRQLSDGQIQSYKQDRIGLDRLASPPAGTHAWFPNIASNFDDDGSPAEYVYVIPLGHSASGQHEITGSDLVANTILARFDCLRIGSEYAANGMPIRSRNAESATPHMQIGSAETRLANYVKSVVASIGDPESISALRSIGLGETTVKFLENPRYRQDLVNSFVHGMEICQTEQFFSDHLPRLDTIWNECQPAATGQDNPSQFARHDGCYFYIILYRINDPRGKTWAVYAGRSVYPSHRLSQHAQDLGVNSPRCVHHRIRKALIERGAEFHMFPISFISKQHADYATLWAWAEQLLVCMFDSFNPVMLAKGSGEQATPYQALIFQEILQKHQLETNRNKDHFENAVQSPIAKHFMAVVKTVQHGIRSLYSTFERHDPAFGCNWSVPSLDSMMGSTALWIRTDIRGPDNEIEKFVFSTKPQRYDNNKRFTLFHGPQGTMLLHCRPHLDSKRDDFLEGSLLHITIDVMARDEPHPFPYFQIPSVGPFDLWDQISRIGIRVDYQATNLQWRSRYLTHSTAYDTFVNKKTYDTFSPLGLTELEPFLETSWVHGVKILATLLRWRWSVESNFTTKVIVPYLGRIRHYELDWLQQTIFVSIPPLTDKQVPVLCDPEENANATEARFGRDVHFQNPGPGFIPGSNKCDICRTLRISKNKGCTSECIPVRKEEGQPIYQCPFCFALRRYCTWTPGVGRNDDYRRLVYQRRVLFEASDIDMPLTVANYTERQVDVEDEIEAQKALDELVSAE